MGASVSQNLIDMTTKTMASVSSSIVQNTRLSEDRSQIISVSNIDGDVHISGNTFRQTATINVDALMTALTTEAAQQQLMLELSQEAKSMISGLNIGQFADASNTIRLLLEAEIHLTSLIKQTCASIERQYQEIIVTRVKGNVFVQNNVFDQMSNIVYKCVQNAVSNSSEIQNLQVKLDQTASATAEGLSPWAIAIIVAVIFGVPVVGGVIGGYVFLKYIFPLIMVGGVIMIVLYFTWTTTDIKMKGFSKFISKTPLCRGSQSSTSTEYSDSVQAHDVCLKNAQCAAFDWQGIEIIRDAQGQTDGSYKLVTPPVTTFYSSVDPSCIDDIGHDDVATVRVPKFLSGPANPEKVIGSTDGDAYLNLTTSNWFQLVSGYWLSQDTYVTDTFKKMTMGTVPPAATLAGQDGDYYVYYDETAPNFVYLYQFQLGNGWVQTQKLRGPGLTPSPPPVTNATGIKVQNKKVWLLYLGIAACVIGAGGSAYVFLKPKTGSTSSAAAAVSMPTNKPEILKVG